MGEVIQKFDENNHLIYVKDAIGNERWWVHNESGFIIHYKDFQGHEEWKKYDKHNRIIHCIDNNGHERWSSGSEVLTKEEVEKIKEQEFLHRKQVSRFELMEVQK